jgi:hypothetical protein
MEILTDVAASNWVSGRIFTVTRSDRVMKGRIVPTDRQNPGLGPPVAVCDPRPGRPACSGFRLLQLTAVSWAAGGPRAELSSHSPQWRRMFSITSVRCRSMKAMIFIWAPHLGQQSGSVS